MRSVAPILAALLVLAIATPAPAVAQSDETEVPDDLFATDDPSLIEMVLGFASGLTERVSATVSGIGSDKSAADLAADIQSTFNGHAADMTPYANDRTNASSSYDTIQIDIEQDGETETRYVVADVNDSDYENVEMVESTDREVDESCTIRGAAARNADTEIADFVDEFVVGDEDISERYLSSMASKYANPVGEDDVSCSFME